MHASSAAKRTRGARRAFSLAATLALAGVAGADAPPTQRAAVLDAVFDGERRRAALETLVAETRLAVDEEIAVRELGRDAHASHHVVAIRSAEPLHRHDHHDLLVVMLRGHGAMHQAGVERAVGEGSILFVPRGTVHAFRNESGEPAVAYAVYWPPLDGEDRVLVRD